MWRAEAAGRDWPQSAPRTWSIAWTCLEHVWGNVCCHHGVLSSPSQLTGYQYPVMMEALRPSFPRFQAMLFCVRVWTDTMITSP